jgi:type I restriction enzyme S subunit
MKSSYKKLGQYIRIVDERNKKLENLPLMGLSVQKKFFPTIANLIGTDMSTYKIVYKNQFTYIADTSRRGDKIAIALNEKFDKMLVSQAYTPFEVIDKNELLPEYLMMWFRRPEFDRYARFKSHGSAREIFDWSEICDTELPIPSIEKQREIVKEYHILVDRIDLNNKLIAKLEETAQAIYKQWFVDFEFPDEKGLPYKSNGGEMEFCEELDKEIPVGWENKKISDLCKCNSSTLSSKDNFTTIEYLDTSNITNNEIGELQILNIKEDEIPSRAKRKVKHNDIIFSTVRPNLKHYGILKDINENMIVSTGFAVLSVSNINLCSEIVYLTITGNDNLSSLQAKAEMSVSTYPSIKPEDLLNLDFLLPNLNVLNIANTIFISTFSLLGNLQKETKKLETLKTLLLSKIATIIN